VNRVMSPIKEFVLLTEATVEKSFRKIINECEHDDATFDRAEELLDELRPESPLRHRLSTEIDELRSLAAKA
jgi:hypothetical protein